jgi:hypothetical protein
LNQGYKNTELEQSLIEDRRRSIGDKVIGVTNLASDGIESARNQFKARKRREDILRLETKIRILESFNTKGSGKKKNM